MVCSRVLPYIKEMVIDETDKYVTTNYTQAKGKVKAVHSDHSTEFVKMNLLVIPNKVENREIYNLKNLQCQSKFKISTEDAQDFSSCFNSKAKLSEKCDRWKYTLNAHIRKNI